MKTDEEKIQTVKKSVSMSADLWAFVERAKGEFGDASRVIQKALRELRERTEELAGEAEARGKAKIKKAREEK